MNEEIKKEHGHFRRNWPFYTLIVLALGLSGYLWISKTSALKRQAKAFNQEKITIIDQAQQALKITSEKQLQMMIKTFVWAVRGEMTRDNLEQVDQYFKQLVKSERIEEITLVDKSGTILISTNKKNEGSLLVSEYADTVLIAEEISITNIDNKEVVTAPVMSLDSRLGTLMIIYQADQFSPSTEVDLSKSN